MSLCARFACAAVTALGATAAWAQLAPSAATVPPAPVVATPDPALPTRGSVQVLTIDTRDTGVDLGLGRLAGDRYPPRARNVATAVPSTGPAMTSTQTPVDVAVPAPGDGAGAMPPESVPRDDMANTARPSESGAAAPSPSSVEPLDAPLSAESMSLDALTAAAAAEASRNRNGTLVRGRITTSP
jgi:hypothetical protein